MIQRKADSYFDGVLTPALKDLDPDSQTNAIADYAAGVGALPESEA